MSTTHCRTTIGRPSHELLLHCLVICQETFSWHVSALLFSLKGNIRCAVTGWMGRKCRKWHRLLRMWPNLLCLRKFQVPKLKSEAAIIFVFKFCWRTALVATFGIELVTWCLKNHHHSSQLWKIGDFDDTLQDNHRKTLQRFFAALLGHLSENHFLTRWCSPIFSQTHHPLCSDRLNGTQMSKTTSSDHGEIWFENQISPILVRIEILLMVVTFRDHIGSNVCWCPFNPMPGTPPSCHSSLVLVLFRIHLKPCVVGLVLSFSRILRKLVWVVPEQRPNKWTQMRPQQLFLNPCHGTCASKGVFASYKPV
jgi:hypothetical protein